MKGAMNNANHFTGMMKLLLGLLVAAIIIYTYIGYTYGKFGNEQLTSILFVLMCGRVAIYGTLYHWPTHLMNLAAIKKMEDYYEILLNQKSSIGPDTGMSRENPEDIKTTCSNGLKFENVDFVYPGSTRQALKQASFELRRGDMVRISGHIGSGKSTIALIALGLYPYEGKVLVCGRDVRTLPRSTISQLVSFIPQGPTLLDRTVYENIAFGTSFSPEQVRQAMDNLEVNFADLDSRVGKGGKNLSTGQRATIYLLRAAMRKSPIIICDEVTANMDAKSEKKVLALLEKISEGRTLIFISHQDVKLNFTKHLVLEKGVITVK